MQKGDSALSARERADREYWRDNKRLIYILLVAWAFVSLGCSVLFVEWLNQFTIGQIPFGFWMGQQGAIYAFLLLILIYVAVMKKLDARHEARLRAAGVANGGAARNGGEGGA
jgi:putative solute:sodium symporter small subunit